MIIGLNGAQYTDLKHLIVKGAIKGFEEQMLKYKQCKTIEVAFEEGLDKIADFFDLIYEKFEKEIDEFFD